MEPGTCSELVHPDLSLQRVWESAERTTRKATGLDGTADLRTLPAYSLPKD